MLSWEYPPNVIGGLGRHVVELAPDLARQGIELHIVTPEPKRQDLPVVVENGAVVHRVFAPMRGAEAIDIYSRAIEVNAILSNYAGRIRETSGRFDLIHAHDWLTSSAASALKNIWAVPLIVTIHATERGRARGHISNDLQRSIDEVERNLIYEAWQVIVCSQYMFNEIQYFFQTPASKLTIVPNGVNLTDLQNGYHPDEALALRQKYADPDDVIIFTISRLVYEKGVHRLIQAAPQILAEYPQARIIIAGTGPEADNLKQQAEALGVLDRVNFTGFISDEDRNHLFKMAACAVFPSLYEPFGIVALEAMALGCPVVVSDVGGFSEVVTHTETGITIYPDNADSVAWGVLYTLNHPDWAQKHALEARRTVQKLFNWPRIAALTIETYQHVLAKQASRSETEESI